MEWAAWVRRARPALVLLIGICVSSWAAAEPPAAVAARLTPFFPGGSLGLLQAMEARQGDGA